MNDQTGGGPRDILVKLYELEPFDPTPLASAGIVIRRPLAPERHLLATWVERHFEAGWASEMEVAFGNRPRSCFIAVRDQEILGFACYDATALGLFGPTGVAEAARGHGIGRALLVATLQAMREQGYAYAVIGAAGPIEFYQRAVGGIVIPDSWPGLYRGLLSGGSGG